ncbi:MAG: 2-oxoacid:acceptor oxidoreductase family protein [Acidimicrobiia bacterium]
MAEYELLLTGIGGQGVQLAAQVVARAATREGREVMFFGIYGGMMRGGNTDSTVVVADGPITAPPVVSRTWSAIAMHDEFWVPIEPKLRPGGLVLVNDSTFTHEITAPVAVMRLPATEIAAGIGNPMGGTMVMAGAYAAITGLVQLDSLVAAMEESIPSYRRQHIESNERALRAGFDAAPADAAHRAWQGEEVSA